MTNWILTPLYQTKNYPGPNKPRVTQSKPLGRYDSIQEARAEVINGIDLDAEKFLITNSLTGEKKLITPDGEISELNQDPTRPNREAEDAVYRKLQG